ncbi:hypothetical protein DL96DRAFT_418405 [Flagelloscypha sp. PMI_526]|nr:hypothetical protein DL96DRAFT_418405 [Flagelloscypha sp. PMI_526]
MHCCFVLALAVATAVLAKTGGASGGGDSENDASGSYPYFAWDYHTESEFILAIVFGGLTLFGGGGWLFRRYTPAVRAAGETVGVWFVWGSWILSLVFHTLAACYGGSYSHLQSKINRTRTPNLEPIASDDQLHEMRILDHIRGAVLAFEALATAGWLFVFLSLSRTLRRATAEAGESSNIRFFHFVIGVFIGLSALFGGIVSPVVTSNLVESSLIPVGTLQFVSSLLTLVTACLSVSAIVLAWKAILSTEKFDGTDLLERVVFAAGLWIAPALKTFVIAVLNVSSTIAILEIVLSIVLFGVASLVTILALPSAVVTMKLSSVSEK